jgi:aryl-alcohol dehydrogenase-like predicted oxidoreductase
MNYRHFGQTDLRVSETGFGAWAIGGAAKVGETAIGWGKTDDLTSLLAIRKALDAGINFFDTADFYGLGHSEELLGREIGKNRECIIATKVGHRNIHETIVFDYTKQYIIDACHESLRRLKRSDIDFYQLHTARMVHLQNGECMEAMNQLQKEGKVRYWGLSLNTFEPAPEADFLLTEKNCSGFQLVFNLINQLALPVMVKAAENKLGIIVRMPLQFGLLTGKIKKESVFEHTDHRSFRLTPEVIETSLHVLEKSSFRLCKKYDCTPATLALSFILAHPAVSVVIPGMRTPEQVVQNTAMPVKMDAGDMKLLHQLYETDWKAVVAEFKKLG